MSGRERSRREFLIKFTLGGRRGLGQSPTTPASRMPTRSCSSRRSPGQPATFAFFTPAQAAEVEAMAAQIIPTDSTPGAREARVIVFIDRILTTFEKDEQTAYAKGLGELAAQTKQLYPQATSFSALRAEQQIKVLTAMEKTPFFNLVRTHTITGFFAAPGARRQRRQGGLEAGELRRLAESQAAVRLLRRPSRLHQPLNAREKRHGQFTPATEVDFVVIGSGAARRHHGQAALDRRLHGRRPRAGRLGQVRQGAGVHEGRVLNDNAALD